MKNMFSWIDNQMKHSALLTEEEQNISVWYYLSQLQPLTKERIHSDNEKKDSRNANIYLDEEASLEDEENEFSLSFSNYLDEDEEDDEFSLNVNDYLDEEVVEGKQLTKKSADFMDSKNDPLVDNFGLDQGDSTKTLLSVKKYVAAAMETDETAVETNNNRNSYQDQVLTIRTLVDFTGGRQSIKNFVSALLASQWENFFPSYLSLNNWLNEFTGDIYVTYHPYFTIQFGSTALTLENFTEFTTMKDGMVKVGIPWFPIFYYTWKFTLSSNDTEKPNQKRLVFLVGERLEREEFFQLNLPVKKQVIIINEKSSSTLKNQVERISKLNAVLKVHCLSTLSFYDLYSNWNINNDNFATNDGGSGTKRVIDIPVYLRMQVNNWAEKKGSFDQLIDLLGTAVCEMCNEWWLEYSPEDVLVVKKIVEIGRCFQTNVITEAEKVFKRNKKIFIDFKSNSFDVKQDFFNKMEQLLIPIYDVLNEN